MSQVNRIPGTNRQSVTGKDGVVLARQYLYLEPQVWDAIHALARESSKSVSQLIAIFAAKGQRILKESNDTSRSRIE
jgi:predicted DNA-binding ribbon-helix-helix protein